MNIFTLLEMAAETSPQRRALAFGATHYSYVEVYRAALVAAEKFRESGCQFVAVLDTSSPAVPVALFGAAAAGIPYVPLNYRLTGDEILALKERIEPLYLVDEGGRNAFLEDCMRGQPADIVVTADPQAVAVQLFTSGTTGTPKAAVLRHSNIMSYILTSVEFGAAAEEDAALVAVPPYHIAGISAVLSSVYAGRRIVQLPHFTPEAWLSLALAERVTNAFLVPTMLARIVVYLEDNPEIEVPSQLQAIAYGGGKMPERVIRKALTLFPSTGFTNAYGLTETSSTICLLGPEDHRQALISDNPAIQARLLSVGRPLPGIDLEIRDAESGVLPAHQTGEVYVRGEQVSGEYREKNVLEGEGWFPTRDAGYIDEDGYLFLSGRADDVIVRGGENISPGEIEDILMGHRGVSDVCVVGLPDEEWGESVAATVVLKPWAHPCTEELQELVKSRLRSSRVPTHIVYRNELPYNEMGKLLRRSVREEMSRQVDLV